MTSEEWARTLTGACIGPPIAAGQIEAAWEKVAQYVAPQGKVAKFRETHGSQTLPSYEEQGEINRSKDEKYKVVVATRKGQVDNGREPKPKRKHSGRSGRYWRKSAAAVVDATSIDDSAGLPDNWLIT